MRRDPVCPLSRHVPHPPRHRGSIPRHSARVCRCRYHGRCRGCRRSAGSGRVQQQPRIVTGRRSPNGLLIPFDANRQGFVAAEGAGIVVLEEYEHAIQRGAVIYAELTGYGNTCDAYHYTAPRPDGICRGKGHEPGTIQARLLPWRSAVHQCTRHRHTAGMIRPKPWLSNWPLEKKQARKALISSTKSMTGHMLGAAGAAEIIASALALKEGVVLPPTVGLENRTRNVIWITFPVKPARQHHHCPVQFLGFGGLMPVWLYVNLNRKVMVKKKLWNFCLTGSICFLWTRWKWTRTK